MKKLRIMENVLRRFMFYTCLCMLVSLAKGQGTACLNQLVPCLQYINSTHTPSSSCCTPLRSLIDSDPGCLCSLLGSTTAIKQAGVNANQAIQLPKRCGGKVNASMCKRSNKQRNAVTSSAEFMSAKPALTVFLVLFMHKIWIIY